MKIQTLSPRPESPAGQAINTFLTREDKWYLGGGDRLLWSPPFPQWLDTLGFWDEAHYFHVALAPLFTVTLLDAEGNEIPYRCRRRRWQPDRLVQTYETEAALTLTETKALTPEDVLTAELTLENTAEAPQTVHVVVWSVQETRPSAAQDYVTSVGHRDGALRFLKHIRHGEQPVQAIGCALGMSRRPDSYAIQLSETGPLMPHWRYTPFYESFEDDHLDDTCRLTGTTNDGRLYLGLHTTLTVPAGGAEAVTFGFCAAPTPDEAEAQLRRVVHDAAPIGRSTEAWADYFAELPAFTCSDPFLEKYYWYRWYGLHLLTTRQGEGNYAYPAVYEGLGYFRKLITFSAQCHLLETRWMPDPALARGSLLNFIHNQREDGSFYGHLFPHWPQEDSFYHANWAHVWALHHNHPDDDFLREAYEGLARYADYFDRERDPENSGLYDIQNHYETGQEYMHRYVAVEEAADQIHWGRQFRLKGVDATVYLYEIKRMLARVAAQFGRSREAAQWQAGAEKTKRAVLERMWDPELELFSDVDPRTGRRTRVKAAVCFYPYFTDLVDERHLPGLKRYLFDPDTFWTPYPVPSSSRDDAYFSARPLWKGKRMNCPWNGRVWPMTNSHVAEALAHSALRFDDDELREQTAAFITRFIRMLFFDGDPERPNCFEHYNPLTGKASVYRGIDDYQHSWVVDLIIKYVCGIRPGETSVTVDPFPFDLDHFRIDDVPVRGARLGVERDGDRFRVFVDGDEVEEQTLGTPVTLSL